MDLREIRQQLYREAVEAAMREHEARTGRVPLYVDVPVYDLKWIATLSVNDVRFLQQLHIAP